METVVRNSNSKQSKFNICYTFGLRFFLYVNNVHSGVYFVIWLMLFISVVEFENKVILNVK